MANLTKTKTLFGFTSPRTVEKIVPEIQILTLNFSGEKWSGNEKTQIDFFQKLYNSEFYEGETFPKNPALAARDRITRAPKALGFIDLTPKIGLTKVGEMLLSGRRPDETFTRQLLKFQLPSPYHIQSKKIEFNVRPYLELLRLISVLGSLSKTEIALFFLQLTNIDKFELIVSKIKLFRINVQKYKSDRKTYIYSCYETEILEIYREEIENNNFEIRERLEASLKNFVEVKSANMRDYADAFVRYIRATELVTFQKKTFRLILSPQKIDEVDYLLKNTPRVALKFKSESEFKSYLFNVFSLPLLSDNKELLINKIVKLGINDFDKELDIESLKDILDEQRELIKTKNIEEKKNELKNLKELPEILEVFKQIRKKEIIDPSLFLEWNTWRALVMLNHAIRIDGNFIMDIDGMPLNYAPGNKPDIISEFESFGMITEVTMSSGNTQYLMEGESVPRHFGKAKEELDKEMYCLFIAPQISEGTLAHYFNLNRFYTKLYGGRTKIIPLSIDQFIDFFKVGVKRFKNPNKLKEWLEKQWALNQNCKDEESWYKQVQTSISLWAE